MNDVVEQQLAAHVHEARMRAEHRRHTDLADRARHDMGDRLHVVAHVGAVFRAVAEQQFVGGERAVAVENRLTSDVDAVIVPVRRLGVQRRHVHDRQPEKW